MTWVIYALIGALLGFLAAKLMTWLAKKYPLTCKITQVCDHSHHHR